MNWRNCLKENQRYDGLSLSLLLSFFFSLSLHFCLFPRLSHRWFIRSAWRWNLSWSYSDLWPPRDLVCHAMSPRSSQSPPSPYVAKKCTLENNAQGGRLTKCPSIYRTSLTKCSIRAGIRFPLFLTYSQDLMDWLTNWLTGRLTDWNFKLRGFALKSHKMNVNEAVLFVNHQLSRVAFHTLCSQIPKGPGAIQDTEEIQRSKWNM